MGAMARIDAAATTQAARALRGLVEAERTIAANHERRGDNALALVHERTADIYAGFLVGMHLKEV